MSYCSQSDYINKFGELELIQLTDRANGIMVDAVVLAQAQAAANSDIDKRLRMKGWDVPLASASADINAIALDLVRFHLYSATSTEEVKAIASTYMRRLGELDAYVAGRIMLDIGEPNTSTASAGDVDFNANDRVFNSNTLSSF